jgi:hypothetical protein
VPDDAGYGQRAQAVESRIPSGARLAGAGPRPGVRRVGHGGASIP